MWLFFFVSMWFSLYTESVNLHVLVTLSENHQHKGFLHVHLVPSATWSISGVDEIFRHWRHFSQETDPPGSWILLHTDPHHLNKSLNLAQLVHCFTSLLQLLTCVIDFQLWSKPVSPSLWPQNKFLYQQLFYSFRVYFFPPIKPFTVTFLKSYSWIGGLILEHF